MVLVLTSLATSLAHAFVRSELSVQLQIEECIQVALSHGFGIIGARDYLL